MTAIRGTFQSMEVFGLGTSLVVSNHAPVPAYPTSAQAIQRALAQGLPRNQEMFSGKVASVAALAKWARPCRRYVARIVRLALLAPDLMQAITRGDVPPALSLDRLKKGFPLEWKTQRASLGFSGQIPERGPALSRFEKPGSLAGGSGGIGPRPGP